MNRAVWVFLAGIVILAGGGYVVYEKTRGIRNNNPGNIKKGPHVVWDGEVLSSDSVFAQFESMDKGVRAIGKLLLTYHDKYGLNSVYSLISRYSATDQAAYIANVSKALGVGSTQMIDVRANLENLVRAIIRQENGPAAIFVSEGDIKLGIAEALA